MSIVFIDTETTGVDPRIHNVWEIGLIEIDGTEHSWLVSTDLLDISSADSTALRLTRFYDRTTIPPVGGQSSKGTIALEVARLTAGKHLVGAVPSFDATFLTKFLYEAGLAPAWHYHLVDVEALAAGRLGLEPPWDSADLANRLNVPILDGKHTALGDARWAREMYYAAFRVHP